MASNRIEIFCASMQNISPEFPPSCITAWPSSKAKEMIAQDQATWMPSLTRCRPVIVQHGGSVVVADLDDDRCVYSNAEKPGWLFQHRPISQSGMTAFKR